MKQSHSLKHITVQFSKYFMTHLPLLNQRLSKKVSFSFFTFEWILDILFFCIRPQSTKRRAGCSTSLAWKDFVASPWAPSEKMAKTFSHTFIQEVVASSQQLQATKGFNEVNVLNWSPDDSIHVHDFSLSGCLFCGIKSWESKQMVAFIPCLPA